MEEIVKSFVLPIFIVLPIYIIIIRSLFKRSFLAKIGYVIIISIIAAMLSTKAIEQAGLPILVGVLVRIGIVILAVLYLKKDIGILQQLQKDLDNIAAYDLCILPNEKAAKRKDEFGSIARSVTQMIQNLKQVIENISSASEAIYMAGNQLSGVAEETSQGANQQATTTEEIATSTEQLLAMVATSAEKAVSTRKTTNEASELMQQNDAIFTKLLKAVEEIVEKITVIAYIADKTDLLSINAAIEASRAGDHGRGFAVVAQEIRKLADKTKSESDKIHELSQQGLSISSEAGHKLAETIPEIIKSAELIGEITASNHEQQNGIELINTSILQLSDITNQNSASAEQIAASAEELTGQAESLKQLIEQFKITS